MKSKGIGLRAPKSMWF